MPTHGRELARAPRDRTRTTPAQEWVTHQANSPDHPIVALQRYIGNQGVQRLLQRAEDDTLMFPTDYISSGGGGFVGPPAPSQSVDQYQGGGGGFVGPPAPSQSVDQYQGGGGGGFVGPPAPSQSVDQYQGGGGGGFVGPPAPSQSVDQYSSGGGHSYENQGPPAPGQGDFVGPVVNEDNQYEPVGPTVNNDNMAAPSFEWT